MKDTSVRRGLFVLFATLVILTLDLVAGPLLWDKARAADVAPPGEAATPAQPVAALVVAECDKIVGFILTDDKGNIIPVPLEGASMDFVNSVLNRVPQSHRLQATLPCKQGTAT